MRYFNSLGLGAILVILIFLTFLEILWVINTEENMATEEAFVWRGNISTHQCDLITFKSNTLESNLYGIYLNSLLLNGCISLIVMFKSH